MGRRGLDSQGWDKSETVVNKVTYLQVARFEVLTAVLLKYSSLLGRDAVT